MTDEAEWKALQEPFGADAISLLPPLETFMLPEGGGK